jgi:acyl-CoA thioesterase-1
MVVGEMTRQRTNAEKRMVVFVLLVTVIIAFVSISANFLFEKGGDAAQIRVACVGDSLTAITGYPNDLQHRLGVRYHVENFGVVGATVLTNTDGPYLNSSDLLEAMNFQAKMVIIMLGTNDARINIFQSSENFEIDYEQLITVFQEMPTSSQIFLVIPPPIFSNNLSLSSDNLAYGIIPHIESVAEKLNLPLIDAYSPLVGHSEFFPDGVHLDKEGALELANIIYEGIFDTE